MKKKPFLLAAIVFNSLLAPIFIVYKILSVIHWSWWWVLSPVLANPVIFMIVFLKFLWQEKFAERKKLVPET
ncbi:MAG: hypothetical protein ACTHJ5_14585 [Ilyomonas sp.]